MIKKNSIDYKKGSETIELLAILPIFIVIILYLSSLIIISLDRQKMEYTVYNIGRAAVVSQTSNDAVTNVKGLLKTTYNLNGSFTSAGGMYKNGDVKFKIEYVDSALGHAKGNYIKIILQKYITGYAPFTSRWYESSMVMMVENNTV